jgi:hypothetical protein
MSLNKLLSVGRSFAGIRDEKSPFEMRKECLLPIFEPSPRLASKAEPASDGGPVQSDWLKHESREASKIGPAAEPATAAAPAGTVRPKSPGQRSLWSILTFGIFDRKPAPGVSLSSALIQPELSLDRVRVMRNDLHDSDLELVLKKRPQARKASVAASSPFAAGPDSAGSRLGGALDRGGTALKI